MILYSVRRYLGFTEDDWDDLSWDVRRAYLDGLSQDESVPFSFLTQDADTAGLPAGPAGPQIRRGVDAGMAVIDLDAMREQMEAARRPGGGNR